MYIYIYIYIYVLTYSRDTGQEAATPTSSRKRIHTYIHIHIPGDTGQQAGTLMLSREDTKDTTGLVEVLKCQLATQFTIQNDYIADIGEALHTSASLALESGS